MNKIYIEELRNFLDSYQKNQKPLKGAKPKNQKDINELHRALNHRDAEKCLKVLLSAAQVAQFVKIIIEFFTTN